MTIRILSGSLKGRLIKTPRTEKTRPITSYLKKSLFDTCQVWIQEARILDLFAGSGAIGIEGISRGAALAYFIDIEKEAIVTIKENLAHLKIDEQAVVIKQDAFKWLENYKDEPFDILFIDPPYPIGLEGYLRLIDLLKANRHISHNESHLFLEAPSQIKKELTPVLEMNFTILKEKVSSTTTLYCLAYKDNLS